MQIRNIVLLSAMLTTACTVGPNYQRPKFFPASAVSSSLHLSGKTQKIDTDWYRQFNDPVLNSLIDRGQIYNPNAEAARQRLIQARQSLRINAVQNLPTLDIGGGYTKSRVSKNYSTLPSNTDEYYRLGFDAAWELDIWGGGRRLTESSLAMVRAAGADYNNVRLSLTAEIAADYINLRQAQEQLRIAQENLRLQQNIYDLVLQKYQSGLADDIALNQAKYIVDTTKQQIPLFEAQVEAWKNALTILAGQLPGELEDTLSAPADNLVSRKFSYNLQQLYDLPVSVLRNRPDVQVTENRLIAQNAKIGQAIAQMFPNISLGGFVGYQSKDAANLFSSGSSMYSFAPELKLPLFHWGALYNNVELQKSLTREQLQLYRAGLLTAAAEIRNSMTQIEKEYARNLSAARAETAQKQVADLTLRKYQEGLAEFSDVLSSQQNLLAAQNAHISSNSTIYQNLINFYKAVGGGYAGSAPANNNRGCRKAATNAACVPCKG